MTVRDAWKAKPTKTRERPKAYIIDGNQTEILAKLKTLGVEVQYLEEDKTYDVEAYEVTYFYRKPIRYEKMKLQTVEVDIKKQEQLFTKGTALVHMNQKRANIVPEVLEPEAPNSFVSFGIITTKKGETLPIYRLLN